MSGMNSIDEEFIRRIAREIFQDEIVKWEHYKRSALYRELHAPKQQAKDTDQEASAAIQEAEDETEGKE